MISNMVTLMQFGNMNMYSIFTAFINAYFLLNSSYTNMFLIYIYYNKITWIKNEQ